MLYTKDIVRFLTKNLFLSLGRYIICKMRVLFEFTPRVSPFVIPVHYNSIIQSFIYVNLEQNLASWLHDHGFAYHKRSFKMFTFSRLFGNSKLRSRHFVFYGPVRFYFSTPYDELLESLVKVLLKKEKIELNDQEVTLSKAEILPIRPTQSPFIIKMLSPLVIYSTFEKDGKKKTYYYNPAEADFQKLVLENLKRKLIAFRGEGKYPELEGAYIKPYRVNERNLSIVKYKGFVIKGWMGLFKLNLPEPYLSLAYDAGLGAKNSQGFGMWEVYKEQMSERGRFIR